MLSKYQSNKLKNIITMGKYSASMSKVIQFINEGNQQNDKAGSNEDRRNW